MSLTAISIDERRQLIAAVRVAYQRKYSSSIPRAKKQRGEQNWASINEIDEALKQLGPKKGGMGAGKFKRFANGKQMRENLINTLNPLARYAGYPDFKSFKEEVQPPAPARLVGLHRAERLQQGYEVLIAARIIAQAGVLPPIWEALLARERAGIDDFLKAYVDLAHLHGYYGQLLDAFVQKLKRTDNQNDMLFGFGLLYYRACLAEDGTGTERNWHAIQQLHLGTSVPAFTHGRWAFAVIMQATEGTGLAQALEQLQAVAVQPPNVAAGRTLPAPYNYFPVGFLFLVCEALFLRQQWPALLEWLAKADAELDKVEFTAEGNVFGEVLSAWQAVALHYTGQATTGEALWQSLRPSLDKTENRWLWDYYQIYLWLSDLHFAVAQEGQSANVTAAQQYIERFGQERNMPFFRSVASRIVSS